MTVDLEYYFNVYNGTVLPNDDSALKALNKSFRQINILCKNKLASGYVDGLDENIQTAVKNIVCEQAEFNTENSDIINAALEKYTINGVTIEYATNQQIANINGIFINQTLFSELSLYGLTYRGF